ncbi:MAG: cytochrome c oxidase subunit, partial [Actinomycetota bacterium]|nr:cytochrome c oxidase subunit [Actinomycetota bacterium]
ASLLVACAAAAIFQAFGSGSAGLWTQTGSRLASANATLALVLGIPAVWIGIASYVVPLQIGATRLALPRLHNLALWSYFGGGVLVTIGYLAAGSDKLNSLVSSAPAIATKGASAPDSVELVIAGLFVVTVATVAAATSLVTTILTRRAEGLRLKFLPHFSWSALATSSVLVLAGPVLLSGLALLAFDQHYGGTLFAAGKGGTRIWQHELWLLGHPLGLLFAAAAVGIFSDIVATHAGRPLVGDGAARIAAAAAPALTLLLWAGNRSTLQSPFSPVSTIGAVAVGLPLGLALLTWLGTLKAGKPRFHPSLLYVVSFLLVVGMATAASIAAIFVHVNGADAEAFRNGQVSALAFGLPLLAIGAAVVHWAPKITGRVLATGAAALPCLLLLGGAVVTAAPGYLVGFGTTNGFVRVGAAGSVLTALGLLALFGAVVKRDAPGSGEANPYAGLTLEWATASPPPLHNFDTIPDVRTPYPLLAADEDAGATK